MTVPFRQPAIDHAAQRGSQVATAPHHPAAFALDDFFVTALSACSAIT